jgi:transcriptional regulator with XRE-family HTH domain
LHHEPEAVTWARQKAGLTKRALAAAIGISEQLMGEIESGWRSATPANLTRIAEALNCPLVALERKRHDVRPVSDAAVQQREVPAPSAGAAGNASHDSGLAHRRLRPQKARERGLQNSTADVSPPRCHPPNITAENGTTNQLPVEVTVTARSRIAIDETTSSGTTPRLVASPFLGQYLLVQPGHAAGVRIPESRYDELRVGTANDQPAPAWLSDAATRAWGTEFRQDQRLRDVLLVRERSRYGYAKELSPVGTVGIGARRSCHRCSVSNDLVPGVGPLTWGNRFS